MKITLIGNGIMAKSLAKGLISNYEVEIIGRDEDKLQKLKKSLPEADIRVLSDEEDITNKNIIFCVKPYALQSVAARLVGKANIFISILAGTKIESLRKHISSVSYIRSMPNIGASTKKSMTTITGDRDAKNLANDIFNTIGKTLWVNTEAQLDIATAVAGSGPAFLSIVAESLMDGAVKAGLEREYSAYLVQGLFEGVSSLLEKNHPAIIKDSVTSPGGTTIAGCSVLEDMGVRSAMIKAIEEAHNKAIEISKK